MNTIRENDMKFRTSLLFLCFTVLWSTACAQKKSSVVYDITFENYSHHEAEISVTFSDIPSETLELRMSRSSPGRYALHEFGKNIYSVRAVDGSGSPLQVVRPDPYKWNVSGHNGTVTVTYTLFADYADGTYSGIDETHAHLNMPATFMWAREMEDVPIEITFHPYAESNWKIATQLPPLREEFTFSAPDLQYFMDSPTELSDYSVREWSVESRGGEAVVRLVVHHDGTETEIDSFRDMVEAVMNEQRAIFGEFPDFDYGAYTFLACYLPYVFGDAMEHRNSTILASSRSLRNSALGNLSSAAHEFFHSWNVERIRPKSLQPFNFEHANMSGELWFAEGFTSYFDALSIKRTDLMSIGQYASSLASSSRDGDLNAVINGNGRKFFSAVGMSRQAPLVDQARSVDPTNRGNTFISYYTYGKVIAIGLDLTLRTQLGLTLDDFMRAMWETHGKTETPYTVADIEIVLGRFTGDGEFAETYFERYVNGRELPDYKALLESAGFLLRKAFPGEAVLGKAPLQFGGGGAAVGSYTAIGSPLYEAGIEKGDVILSIDGMRISNRQTLDSVISSHKPGDSVSVRFVTRAGIEKTSDITLAEHDRLEVVLYEDASLPVTEEMKQFRENWLGSQVQ